MWVDAKRGKTFIQANPCQPYPAFMSVMAIMNEAHELPYEERMDIMIW